MLNREARIAFGGDHTAPNQLILGDNLQILSGWDAETVDMVYVDPPFGTGTVRTGRDGKQYDDRLTDPQTFVRWLLPRLSQARRVLTKTGSLFVHLDYRTVHYVKVALDEVFGHKRFVNELIWCYSVGGKSRRSFGKKHDTILWYSKTDKYAFYPDDVRVPRKAKSHMRVVYDENGAPVQEKTDKRTGRVYRYPVKEGKVPEDWWCDIETLNRSDKQRVGWPTQKPERLLERLIKGTTRPGDVVADWFAGSGTTAVVAQRLGRRFVTSDQAIRSVECTRARLEDAGQALSGEGCSPPDILVRTWKDKV